LVVPRSIPTARDMCVVLLFTFVGRESESARIKFADWFL